jgi:hypothetical protein
MAESRANHLLRCNGSPSPEGDFRPAAFKIFRLGRPIRWAVGRGAFKRHLSLGIEVSQAKKGPSNKSAQLGYRICFDSATRTNTANLPRCAVSILKVIDQAISPISQSRVHSSHPSTDSLVVHPSTQLDFTENRGLKRNWNDRILGTARILGAYRSDLPDAMLSYVQLFDFQIQRRPRNSEFGSRSVRSSNFSVAFRQSRFDEFPFVTLKGLCQRT